MLLLTWTADIPPDIGEQDGLIPGGRAAWYDITIEVTNPDGTTQTLTLARTDPVGSGYINYVPDQVGTYYLQAFFTETWKNTTTIQRYYSSAVSPITSFTVQQDPIEGWPETPLPTDYWTRPINSANRDWYVLAGNWLGTYANVWPHGAAGGVTSNYGYGLAPESAHILWTKPYYAGGIMDERLGNIGFRAGNGYQGVTLANPIIINGHLIVVNRETAHTTSGWWVIDLYTGETLSFENDTGIPAFGQVYDYESPNQHGGFAYLWRTSGVTLPALVRIGRSRTQVNSTTIITGTLWEMIDAYTENTVCYIANVSSSGTAVYAKDGSILRYNIVNYGTSAAPNYHLTVWNSSAISSIAPGDTGTNAWMWRPSGGGAGGAGYSNVIHDGSTGFSLNVSIPSILGPRNAFLNQTATVKAVREGEFVIVGTVGRNDERGIVPGWLMAFSLERGLEGTKLWETTFTPPYAPGNSSTSMTGVYPEDGVILFENTKLLKRWGYDMTTGALLWESEPELQMNYYAMNENVYQGMLFSTSWSGILIAYNMTTGAIEWTYKATNIGFESPYGNYPMGFGTIADGKIYLASNEHSITQPMWRGPNLRCINASNGAELWKIMFSGAGYTLRPTLISADGIIIGLNYYDMQIYAFGKGPSATTVTASPKVSVMGSSVVIEGTVTDQTPAVKGTPAISDEDMSAWMEYMFMQQPMPEDAKGVKVKLTAIDPNGNYQDIGYATSDTAGNFGKSWQPPVPGEYFITAEFEGSASYGSSFDTTFFTVDPAPSPGAPIEPEPTTPEPTTPEPTTPEPTTPEPTTPEPTTPEPTEPEPTEAAEAPLITTEIAIVAVVAVACVIGIVSFWALRRRK